MWYDQSFELYVYFENILFCVYIRIIREVSQEYQ